jgi:hypothetical protein
LGKMHQSQERRSPQVSTFAMMATMSLIGTSRTSGNV